MISFVLLYITAAFEKKSQFIIKFHLQVVFYFLLVIFHCQLLSFEFWLEELWLLVLLLAVDVSNPRFVGHHLRIWKK